MNRSELHRMPLPAQFDSRPPDQATEEHAGERTEEDVWREEADEAASIESMAEQ
jgi:hypothetical protein